MHLDQFGWECVTVLWVAFYDRSEREDGSDRKGLRGTAGLSRGFQGFQGLPGRMNSLQQTHEGRLRGLAGREAAERTVRARASPRPATDHPPLTHAKKQRKRRSFLLPCFLCVTDCIYQILGPSVHSPQAVSSSYQILKEE
jgi:hypothetical protein